jgi:phosphoglycolate phosphatase-like HAD superfamily hydrolase
MNGWISPEEGFDPMCIASIGDRGNWPLDLSHDVREAFRKLHAEGRIFDDQPSYFIGRDRAGIYKASAFIAVTRDLGVFATTAMRAQQFDVGQAEALEILIYFEVYEALKRVLAGKAKPNDLNALMERMERSKQGLQMCREATMNSDWTTRSMFGTDRLS